MRLNKGSIKGTFGEPKKFAHHGFGTLKPKSRKKSAHTYTINAQRKKLIKSILRKDEEVEL